MLLIINVRKILLRRKALLFWRLNNVWLVAGGSGRHYQIEILIIILISDIRYDAPEPSRLTRLLFISPVLLLDGVVPHQSPQASGVLGLQFASLFEESSIPGVHLLPRLGHLHTNMTTISHRKVPLTSLRTDSYLSHSSVPQLILLVGWSIRMSRY